jgi:signal transduction histidine kinase
LAITSVNKKTAFRGYGNTQFRYAMTYVVITFVVLLFLNIYCSRISQRIFYLNKESSMLEKCHLVSSEIAKMDVVNSSTVANLITQMESMKVTRIIVTDQAGMTIYDTGDTALGTYALLPEIMQALDGSGNNVFSWNYHDGVMHSKAATPIYSYGTLTGCVYMMELDAQQGMLMKSLQSNILSITVVLEVMVILFSLAFSRAFSVRLRRILTSMRIIREGEYSHKVTMGGNDELTVLGEEFNSLTDRLQASENKRRQFVSDASHELKTPLASIKLLSDSILQNDMDMETIHEFVADIGNEADRLNRMSQKLLSLSRIEGQQDGDCEIIYMAPTAERVVRMLQAIAHENHIRIETELADDCPILILEDDLYQITFNLVENGIKYNTPGGILSIRLSRDGDWGILEVSDSGVGIPSDAIDHIFERFYRVDKARSRKSGGSGLGLSIVRSMVERNGGEISVKSQVGEGTTFTVRFPAFDMDRVSE